MPLSCGPFRRWCRIAGLWLAMDGIQRAAGGDSVATAGFTEKSDAAVGPARRGGAGRGAGAAGPSVRHGLPVFWAGFGAFLRKTSPEANPGLIALLIALSGGGMQSEGGNAAVAQPSMLHAITPGRAIVAIA